MCASAHIRELVMDWHMTGFNVVAYREHMLAHARTFTPDPGHCLTRLCVSFFYILSHLTFIAVFSLDALTRFFFLYLPLFFLCSKHINTFQLKNKRQIKVTTYVKAAQCMCVCMLCSCGCSMFQRYVGFIVAFFMSVGYSISVKTKVLYSICKCNICIQCMFRIWCLFFFASFLKIDVVHFITKFSVYTTAATNGYNSLANKFFFFWCISVQIVQLR